MLRSTLRKQAFGVSAARRWKHRPLVQTGEISSANLHNFRRKKMEPLWGKLNRIHVEQDKTTTPAKIEPGELLLEEIGGGGWTRTSDLRIMRT
jgi:hypothetical protein